MLGVVQKNKEYIMDERLFKKIAEEIEKEWQMGGLSDGIYYDYALEIARRYFSVQPPMQSTS